MNSAEDEYNACIYVIILYSFSCLVSDGVKALGKRALPACGVAHASLYISFHWKI